MTKDDRHYKPEVNIVYKVKAYPWENKKNDHFYNSLFMKIISNSRSIQNNFL